MKAKRAVMYGLAMVVAFAALACSESEHEAAADMPAPPSDLKVEPLTGGAHLTWKDNSDNESAFMLERAAGAEAFASLATVPFDAVQYHDGAVTPGATYRYRVMAMPKDGGHPADSEYSNEVTFIAPAAEVEPAPSAEGGAHSGH